MKTCTRCKLEKAVADFAKDSKSRDGRSSRCRQCMADVQRQWAIDNRDRRRENNRRWRNKRLSKSVAIEPPIYQREISRLGDEAIAEAAKRRNVKRRKPPGAIETEAIEFDDRMSRLTSSILARHDRARHARRWDKPRPMPTVRKFVNQLRRANDYRGIPYAAVKERLSSLGLIDGDLIRSGAIAGQPE